MTLPSNYDDDLILYSEDGIIWLPYRAWLLTVMSNHPERLREPATGTVAAANTVTDREEAMTRSADLFPCLSPDKYGYGSAPRVRRAGRGQGILARTSPLANERRTKGADA